MPRRIGIWGGSFDPVHIGHLLLAQEAVDRCGLDDLIWMPSGAPPHRSGPVASGQHRIEMVGLAIRGSDAFSVSDLEVGRAGKSYTIQTLVDIREQVGEGHQLFLLIGADNAVDFGNWYEPDRVLDLAEVVVFGRPGFDLADVPQSLAIRMRFLETPLFEVSSTAIRERVGGGRPIRYWVPESVRTYIDEHGLYC